MGILGHVANSPAENLQISSEHPLGDRIRVPYRNKDDQPCVFVPLLVEEPVQPSLSVNVRIGYKCITSTFPCVQRTALERLRRS